MSRMLNIFRMPLTITILLAFLILVPIASAKHIIVIYDVSGSMVRTWSRSRIHTNMESEDIRRVNNYLTDFLFTDVSQPVRHSQDSEIKSPDPAFVGRPLYQPDDILTYAEYADRRYEKISRAPVQRGEFQQNLPNPVDLLSAFRGHVSYLLRAKMEVYDELYNPNDHETYWVFVTDGDVDNSDNSGKSDPAISSVLKRLAEIEDEYYAPMIRSVLVNDHVQILIRRLQKRDDIESIFIATSTQPKQSAQKIQVSRDETGTFVSEPLTIDTENTAKTKFRLSAVNVKIVDKFNKPLQVINAGGTVPLKVAPVALAGNSPPYEFRIPLPANLEIAAPGNALKLEVTYSYNGTEKAPYSAPTMNYTAVIDDVYVALQENSDTPAKELEFLFYEGTYLEDLRIETESPNKADFAIKKVQAHIQDREGKKLADVTTSPAPTRLNQNFAVELSKTERLNWSGNKLILDIDYTYDGDAKSTTIAIPFKIQGGSGFPTWLLWFFGIVTLLVIGVFLTPRLKPLLFPSAITHHISLTQVNAAGKPLGQTEYFELKNEDILNFKKPDNTPDSSDGDNSPYFDVGSPAFLCCDKSNILFFEDPEADKGKTLEPDTILKIKGTDGAKIRIRCEIEKAADEEADTPDPHDQPIVQSNDPLDI